MAYELSELAAAVGAEIRGDASRRVERVRPLDEAEASDLSFFTNAKYRELARSSQAALLVSEDHAEGLEGDLLVSSNPYLALAGILRVFHPATAAPRGVDPLASVAASARVHPAASVGPFAVIGEESVVGEESCIGPHVVLGRGCSVGRGCVLHPHAVLYDDTVLGDRVIVHAGVVLGADGFGFASDEGGLAKLPQVGHVVVEDDVEIGANSTVDRATLTVTRLGAGAKLDNLVQIGHNVEVGAHSILCGQAGVSGSTKLGRGVVLAGQSGVAGHLRLGDGARVAAKSAVFKDVPEAATVAGIPAMPATAWKRQTALLRHLRKINLRVGALERHLQRESKT